MTCCKRLSSALLDQIVELHGGGQMYGSVVRTAEYGSVVQCMTQCMGQWMYGSVVQCSAEEEFSGDLLSKLVHTICPPKVSWICHLL